jgi:hypothetical protein
MPESLFPPTEAHVIDTNLFIAFERTDSLSLLERAVTGRGIEFLLPERVYDELTPEGLPYETPPIDQAIDDGWVRIIQDIDYSDPVVSNTMDMVRRYIAAADGRSEHDIEQADAVVGGVTATLLVKEQVESVAVYTSDRAAFRGIERALAEHGYNNRVQLVRAFDFFDAVQDRYQFES